MRCAIVKTQLTVRIYITKEKPEKKKEIIKKRVISKTTSGAYEADKKHKQVLRS